ncbi:maleylpyruvate isomerase N-terminal domain-containing protein, partial [Streptomyces rubiginosohelvolus]
RPRSRTACSTRRPPTSRPRTPCSLPRDLYHVTNELSRYMEVQVDVRRCHTAPEMTSELEYTVIRRGRQLRNEKREPDAMVRWPGGTEVALGEALTRRAFDLWVHEQDLDSPGATITRDLLLSGLPKVVAKDAGAAPQSAVVFDVHGPMEFMRTVRVDADGRGSIDGSVSLGPTVTLTVDWETYVRLACGRVRPEAVTGRLSSA